MKSSSSTKPLMIALVIITIILVAVVAYLAGKGSAQPAANPPAPTQKQTTEAAKEPSTAKDSAANKAAQPAKKVTDPAQVAAMAQQVKRDPADKRAQGSVDAPVVMVEYGDFSCPMCARYEFNTAPQLKKLVDEGKLRIEWRDLSFFRDHNSQLAAAGGVAAAKQGKFWEYKHAAYELSAQGGHPDWNDELVKQVAQKAGVGDIEKFMNDYKSPDALAQVDAETETASRMGITGTPFFIINDRFISGAWPTQHFLATIEAAAADAK